ncbi:hypothetical protein U1Q18_005053 [Sarracenia purpurea var. burkii]
MAAGGVSLCAAVGGPTMAVIFGFWCFCYGLQMFSELMVFAQILVALVLLERAGLVSCPCTPHMPGFLLLLLLLCLGLSVDVCDWGIFVVAASLHSCMVIPVSPARCCLPSTMPGCGKAIVSAAAKWGCLLVLLVP